MKNSLLSFLNIEYIPLVFYSEKFFYISLPLFFHGHFLILPVYAVVFECCSLQYLAPQRRKSEKWQGSEGKGTGLMNSHDFASASGRGAYNNGKRHNTDCRPLCLHFCDQERLSAYSAAREYVEDRVFFAHPGSLRLCTSCSRNHTQLSAMWLGGMITAMVLRAEIDLN